MARAQQNSNNRREERNALVVHAPRLPAPPAEMLKRFGLDASGWKTLVEAVWPSAKTVDGVAMALDYCKARGLDPFKKPVYIVPMWNSAIGAEVETVWPGINDYRTTANRTGQHAGNDDCLFGPTIKRGFKEVVEREKRNGEKYSLRAECPQFEFPESAQVTVYRIIQGQRMPFVGPKVRFVETFSGEKGLRVPNTRWQQAPFQMLEKCAEAAALRRAFPEEFSGTYTAEEMEGKEFHRGPTIEATAVYHEESEDPDRDDRPTRAEAEETGEWTGKGIPKHCWDEIEALQKSIDAPGSTVIGLRAGKSDYVDRFVADSWPEAALDELELRFDTRIAFLEGGDTDDGTTDQEESEDENEQTN